MPKFEKEEYDVRIAKVRRSMAEKNIVVLIVTDPSNMAWLTGYDGWSFYVHQVRGLDFGRRAPFVWTWNKRQRSKELGVHVT